MIIRKFYNAEAVETPAAAEVVTETVVETPATPSLVEMMAKNGVMNNGNMVVTPTNTESTEKPTATVWLLSTSSEEYHHGLSTRIQLPSLARSDPDQVPRRLCIHNQRQWLVNARCQRRRPDADTPT